MLVALVALREAFAIGPKVRCDNTSVSHHGASIGANKMDLVIIYA